MSNIIHSRPTSPDGAEALYLDSIDRGAKGERGEQGKEGKQGEQGKTGIGVTGIFISDNDHLMTKMSDGSEIDAGELPKVIARCAFSCTLDGTTNRIPISATVNTERVTHLLINGVTYTSGFSFDGQELVLDFAKTEIPTGKLEIFVNTHSRSGEVETPLDLQALTTDELNNMLKLEEV